MFQNSTSTLEVHHVQYSNPYLHQSPYSYPYRARWPYERIFSEFRETPSLSSSDADVEDISERFDRELSSTEPSINYSSDNYYNESGSDYENDWNDRGNPNDYKPRKGSKSEDESHTTSGPLDLCINTIFRGMGAVFWVAKWSLTPIELFLPRFSVQMQDTWNQAVSLITHQRVIYHGVIQNVDDTINNIFFRIPWGLLKLAFTGLALAGMYVIRLILYIFHGLWRLARDVCHYLRWPVLAILVYTSLLVVLNYEWPGAVINLDEKGDSWPNWG